MTALARHRRPPAALAGPAGLVALALGLGLAGAACAPAEDSRPDAAHGSPAATTGSLDDPSDGDDAADEPTAEAVVPQPLSWGPTDAELAQAQEMVAGWSPGRLAGQVIVGRYAGTDPAIPGAMVRDLHLAGVCVTGDNVVDAEQVRATNRAVSAAVAADGRDFPAVIGVDQEGGVVSHLRGIATEFPTFATAGEAVAEGGARGRTAVRRAAEATGLELRDLGFTWVFAPVADVTIGAADPTIGSRSPSTDPGIAGQVVAAAVRGYDRSGTVSTTKHFPGHGGATADSHETLPTLTAPLGELTSRDLAPFADAVEAGAPAVMVGHLDVQAIAPGRPSTLAPEVYDVLRDDLGFEGLAITDSLGMGAVAGIPDLAVKALAAGADLLLMPADTARTHARLTRAVRTGEVTPERVEEAAARVVALQLWQARVAGDRPVPDDVEEMAEAASTGLVEAASD